jgi:hypothetical protein
MKKIFLLLATVVPAGTAWEKAFHFSHDRINCRFSRMMHSQPTKSSVSFFDLIESIKNMIDHIFVFIQKNGGGVAYHCADVGVCFCNLSEKKTR